MIDEEKAFWIVDVFIIDCRYASWRLRAGERRAEKEEGKASEFSVAMVTDVGGIDDKSFNQSAWEGLQKLVKKTV